MDHEHVASMIGDYAMDRLGDDEKGELEGHLGSCASCRALLEQARELKEVLPGAGSEALLAHVQAEHLTRYARNPRALEPRLTSWIEEHLQSCTPCREAVEIVRDLESDGKPGGEPSLTTPRPDRVTLWDWLARTLLRPVPAMAYLVLLVAVVGLWIGGRDSSTPAPHTNIELLLPGVSLYPEERFRSGESHEAEPVEIAFEAGRDLYLRVHTEIDDRILADAAAAFRLEISGGGQDVASRRLDRFELSDLGILSLKLRGEALRAGESYRVEVRLDHPASSRHDEVLFERTFRLIASGGAR
jgi:hypothetical protein